MRIGAKNFIAHLRAPETRDEVLDSLGSLHVKVDVIKNAFFDGQRLDILAHVARDEAGPSGSQDPVVWCQDPVGWCRDPVCQDPVDPVGQDHVVWCQDPVVWCQDPVDPVGQDPVVWCQDPVVWCQDPVVPGPCGVVPGPCGEVPGPCGARTLWTLWYQDPVVWYQDPVGQDPVVWCQDPVDPVVWYQDPVGQDPVVRDQDPVDPVVWCQDPVGWCRDPVCQDPVDPVGQDPVVWCQDPVVRCQDPVGPGPCGEVPGPCGPGPCRTLWCQNPVVWCHDPVCQNPVVRCQDPVGVQQDPVVRYQDPVVPEPCDLNSQVFQASQALICTSVKGVTDYGTGQRVQVVVAKDPDTVTGDLDTSLAHLALDKNKKATKHLKAPQRKEQNVGPNSAGQPASEANVGELAERIAAAAAAAVAAAPGQDRMTTMAAFTNAAAHLVTLARSFPDPVSTSRIASAVLPTHGPQSNVKVTLPAIRKWGLKCLFDGRDLDLFLTDCQQFARASNQAPAATIILMVSDELRRVLNLQVSQAMSLGKQLTEQEVVASLKELIGYNMHDAKHIAMTRLVHGSVKQRTDQTVLEYAVDFRLEVMRADALPTAVLCDLFVKGLKATIAAQCARTSAGLLWTDLNECITYAIGKEATMPGGSRSGAPVAILSHQDQRKGVDRGHSSFPARGRGRGVQGLMTSDEGHQFKRDGGQWQPVPQGFVPHGGGGRGGPLRGRRGDDQWDRGYDQSSHGKAGVAMAVEAHGEARAVAAKEAQEVVAAREALGVVAVRGDGKEARVASRVAAKAVGKEATVAKEAVGWVALSSQHLLLRQCFTSLMSHLPVSIVHPIHASAHGNRNLPGLV
ncbi:hypothetical protein QJQ45_004437 [Haematococcus lacustris]|nr:hypothetical protein QJQ45_004437 [Haematococcus lacustris]